MFSALFDTRRLSACGRNGAGGLCVLWPNLSFRAADLLGNERVAAYDIGIDNQPPQIDLDPPQLRLIKFDEGYRCSWSFDPLGPFLGLGDMPNDGCGVPQVFDLRARVEDQANPATGSKAPPTALVDRTSVTAYVLDDTNQALVVDLDGDGVCDGVNPLLVPTTMPPAQSNEILAVRLAPVMVQGDGNFTRDPSVGMEPALASRCVAGKDQNSPAPLCARQELTVAMGYPTAQDTEPAIWTIEPVGTNRCVGSQLDTHANRIQEGWACIAVAATDRVGNAGVSHPLRVYVRYRGDQLTVDPRGPSGCGSMAPPAGAGALPDCTGVYDRATNRVVAGSCTGPRFPTGELRYR